VIQDMFRRIIWSKKLVLCVCVCLVVKFLSGYMIVVVHCIISIF